MKKIILLLLVTLSISCNKKNLNEVNLYSQRHYNVDKKQYENFEKLTGIKVNVVKANADELIERLKNVESEHTSSELSRLGTKSNIKD